MAWIKTVSSELYIDESSDKTDTEDFLSDAERGVVLAPRE